MKGQSRLRAALLVVAAAAVLAATGLAGDAFGRAADSWTFRVHVTGNGTITGAGFNCRSDGGPVCTVTYTTAGQAVDWVATPDPGWTFAGWVDATSDDCPDSPSTPTVCTGVSSDDADSGGDDEYAVFTQNPGNSGAAATFPLSVSVTGNGSVTGGGISCGAIGATCTQNETSGSSVTLTETPAGGTTFSGWSGACTGTATTCVVTMSAARSVQAAFSGASPTPPPAGGIVLTVTLTGNGVVTGGGIDCGVGASTCSQSEASGSLVTLKAATAGGSTFTGWSGACAGTSSTCSVSMSASKSVHATFSGGETFPLSVGVSGGGTVAGGGINCTSAVPSCTVLELPNAKIVLTATPGTGGTFRGWSGACSGTTPTCTVTMTAAMSVGATFSGGSAPPPPPGAVALTITVTGKGTVTAPGGACAGKGPATTCTQSYAVGKAVALTATPATGGAFMGWGGACSGKTTCTVTMSTARTVTAAFTGGTAPPPPTGGALNLKSLGDPIVVSAGRAYSVTIRFNTSRTGTAQLRIFRAGRPMSTISFTARAGDVRFGPFVLTAGGAYTMVLVVTDLSGQTRTLEWSTCLGSCTVVPTTPKTTPTTPTKPSAGLKLVRAAPTVTHVGSHYQVTLHFTTSAAITANVQVYRNGKAALKAPVKFSFPVGKVSVGPFGVNQDGSYRFVLTANDKRNRHGLLTWLVVIPKTP